MSLSAGQDTPHIYPERIIRFAPPAASLSSTLESSELVHPSQCTLTRGSHNVSRQEGLSRDWMSQIVPGTWQAWRGPCLAERQSPSAAGPLLLHEIPCVCLEATQRGWL